MSAVPSAHDGTVNGTRLAGGIASALGAGLLWGLVFVTPAILPDYPPAVLSVGRYLAFGLIALALAWPQRRALARLARADWFEAARLSLVGNLAYYTFLAAAIQLSGVPLPTLIIGTLPVVIAVTANAAERTIPWRRLAAPLAAIGIGIATLNHAELARAGAAAASVTAAGTEDDSMRHVLGALLALAALACWTWYPIRNARWLRTHTGSSPGTWATAQGLMTLPLATAGALLLMAWYRLGANAEGSVMVGSAVSAGSAMSAGYAWPLGPDPVRFIGMMLALGLTASWLGTLLWNRASRMLPTSLAGQLIVFETLSALAYAYSWRGEAPSLTALAGIAILVAGVVLGVRAFQQSGPSRQQTGAPA
jgi:drug/metabolite transporter (DMT)-like permease